MRRLALSVLTACGLALLTACSAGTGLSTSGNGNNPTFVEFTNGSGQANDFTVSAAGVSQYGPPLLQINALAAKTNGPATIFLPDRAFLWAARFVNPATDPPSVAQVLAGPVPNGFTACPAKPAATPAVPLLWVPPGSFTPALVSGNEPATIYVAIPAGPTPPYCLAIQATDVQSGVIGSVTMEVVK
jgi:hypothetical protein